MSGVGVSRCGGGVPVWEGGISSSLLGSSLSVTRGLEERFDEVTGFSERS